MANESALVQLAQNQGARSNQLFQEANPGFVTADNFYSVLASGDPYAIARATAPEAQQINQATEGSIKNIIQNAPNGGEKNLAIEEARVAQGANIGKVTSGAALNSYNALAALAGQGTGESISSAGTAISGFGSANQGLATIGQQQIEQQQIQAQQKGSTLGALASLGGSIAEGAGAAGSLGALFAL